MLTMLTNVRFNDDKIYKKEVLNMENQEHYKFKEQRWLNGDSEKEDRATEKLLSALFGEDVKIKNDNKEE